MMVVTGKCILVDKCHYSDSVLVGPNRKVYKDCGLPIHVERAITMGLKLQKKIIALMITCAMTK